jgi:CRP/FNR family cyclic AMP-dependent transcriptional regulator
MPGVEAGAVARSVLSAGRGPGRLGAEWVPVLEEVPLFRGLSRRHLRRIAALARTRRFAPGSAIVRAGEPGNAFYVVLDGAARVRAGGRATTLRAGDAFGEMALLDDAPRSASVTADGEVLTMTIGRAAFTKLLRREPQISHALLRILAARLRAAEKLD